METLVVGMANRGDLFRNWTTPYTELHLSTGERLHMDTFEEEFIGQLKHMDPMLPFMWFLVLLFLIGCLILIYLYPDDELNVQYVFANPLGEDLVAVIPLEDI